MGKVRIKINVKGGIAPVPILVFIDKIDSHDDIRIKRKGSFDETFVVSQGEHNVIISGENSIEGNTSVEVEYTNNDNVTKSKKYSISNPIYSKIFKVFI